MGAVPQSINIGINGDFAPWVGALIENVKQPIMLVADIDKIEESITRLSRVGFDHVIGHLKGGFEAWKKAGFGIETVNRITVQTFENEWNNNDKIVIDIRKFNEYEAEHVAEAFLRPLAEINDWIKDIDPEKHFFLHCAGGYRSMIAASILQARGYRNFSEIEGGFNAISKTNVPKTDFICQSKVH